MVKKELIKEISLLLSDYPQIPLMQHIEIACNEYKDLGKIDNKNLHESLNNYLSNLEFAQHIIPEDDDYYAE